MKIKYGLLPLLLLTTTVHASLQETAPNKITFATIARAPQGKPIALYVGASPRVQGLDYKLARIIQATPDNVTGVVNVLQKFAPAKVNLGGQADSDHPLTAANVSIAQLATLAGHLPVFTVAESGVKATDLPKFPAANGLCLVTDEVKGDALIAAQPLIDQAGGTVDAVPAALTAGKDLVFAAVSAAGTQFDDPLQKDRGIAILQYASAATTVNPEAESGSGASTELKQLNASQDAAQPQALPISLSAKAATSAPVVAFGDGTANNIDHAVVGRAASLAWDENLQRLYLGFNAARRDVPSLGGGVLGVCMAFPTKDAAGVIQHFSAAPIVDSPNQGLFFSALNAPITEGSNPDGSVNRLPGITGAANFSVALVDIQICLKILKAAIAYVRAPAAGNNAGALLAFLDGSALVNAGINFGVGGAGVFFSAFNAGGIGVDHLNIFGVDTLVVAAPAGAGSDAALRDAIRARFVQLLANAKIVNQAYAMGNLPNSVYTNSLDMVIGLYADGSTLRIDAEETGITMARNDGDDDLAVSIPRMTVMNTSTGRPYLIVHSVMVTSPVGLGGTMYNEADNWIYALPLISTDLNGQAYLKGSLARVTNDNVGKIELTAGPGVVPDQYQVPQVITHMPKRFQTAVRVGGGNPVPASWVQDLFVSGDSVYVTLAGLQPGQQGVFKSTAIFDNKGCITSWTPATRVMGSVQQTFGAMLDKTSANFYSLASAGNGGATTGQVTQWEKKVGPGSASGMTGGGDERKRALDVVLGSLFDQKKGGVHGVIAFDELTYGFPAKQLSAVMAYGFDGVAFATTGERRGMAFVPVTQHTAQDIPATATTPALDQNVWNFNVGVGPITCGAAVHNPGNWTRLYVGGYRGLVQLEVPFPDAATFLANIQNIGTGLLVFNPVPLIGANPVGPVITVGQTVVSRDPAGAINSSYLHALTGNDLLLQQVIGGVATNRIVLGGVLDGAVLADGTIAATATGLTFVPANGVAPVQLNAPAIIPLQIQVLASRDKDGLFALPATVYVLGMGSSKLDDVAPAAGTTAPVASTVLVPQLWRVAVYYEKDAAGVPQLQSGVLDTYQFNTPLKGQPRPYEQFPNLRLNFSTDGSILFDASSRDGGNNDFLRVGELTAPSPELASFVGLQTSVTDLLSIDRNGNFKIGVPARNSATGSWLVPGDWGLRVNE